jgi:predicted nucleic acid-binding Zn ribbon protein
MLDKPLKKCPKCKKPKLRRLLGAGAGIIFKGSGFYQTDYRSESYKSAAKADENAAKPSSTDGKKSDDKAGATGPADTKSPAKNSKSKA